MAKRIGIILALLSMLYGVSEAQVTPGSVNSKTDDGVGNKITSTVVGPSRGLDVNVIAGGGSVGVPYLDADAIANQTTTAIHGQTYMYNGATWDRVRGTIAGGLQVNCVTGCAGGASTPTDAFANPTTAGLQQTFNMGWNGASWDRLRSSIANGLVVDVSRISGTVGVTQSTSPWVVSGTVTANAGTNLNTSALLLDATFTGRWAVASLDADAIANETTTSVHGKCYLYNGASWDRCRGAVVTGMLVNVSNASIAVTGTFFQTTQPVSIATMPLTEVRSEDGSLVSLGSKSDAPASTIGNASVIALLKALNLELTKIMSGVNVTNFPTTQGVSGTVAVSNFPTSILATTNGPIGFAQPPCNPVRRTQCQNQGNSYGVSGF